MKNLTALKKEMDAAWNKYHELRAEYQDIEDAYKVPVLKKKYEGKYFKYWNGDGEKHWWLYFHVLGVESQSFDIFEFQSHDNKVIFEKTTHGEGMMKIEISGTEYHEAFKAALSEINTLGL